MAPQALHAVLREVEKGNAALVERLLGNLAEVVDPNELAALEELALLRELGAFDLFDAYDLQVVDFIPDHGGGPGSMSDPFGMGETEDGVSSCYLCPALPSKESFAGFSYRRGHTPGDDPGRYHRRAESAGTGPNGRLTVVYREYDKSERNTAVGFVIFEPDGSSYERRVDYHTPQGTTETQTDRDSDGDVVSETVKPVNDPPPDKPDPAPKPDAPEKPDPKEPLDKYQPGEGEQDGVCPLIIDYCRRVAEALAEDASDPYRLVSGSVLVNPPPPGEEPTAGPRLEIDTHGLVVNPDPTSGPVASPGPKRFLVAFPVLVLPPRPGSGPE